MLYSGSPGLLLSAGIIVYLLSQVYLASIMLASSFQLLWGSSSLSNCFLSYHLKAHRWALEQHLLLAGHHPDWVLRLLCHNIMLNSMACPGSSLSRGHLAMDFWPLLLKVTVYSDRESPRGSTQLAHILDTAVADLLHWLNLLLHYCDLATCTYCW